ncbi:ATP-dependent helicase [Bacteroides heparinolyticus]|uniref:ATP-dependent helicase n=1 Tax=Prevotella heparinolytica TaxID=28113 RepID=A0A449I6N8_9BACE|nr:helicase-related protein [Bacteroides heparinolyticus]VFB15091.1 ATP-dependent helicase [Bacteroides heparinolyticus]
MGEKPQDPKFDAFKENIKQNCLIHKRIPLENWLSFGSYRHSTIACERVKAKGYKALSLLRNRDEMEHTIEENFDANYEGVWKDDYNVIITTEVLAEGVNLHRANVILNYDTPWNSTRLMQRIVV